MNTITYRMRAQCMHDVACFASRVFCATMMVQREAPYPDVVVTFISELGLEDLLNLIQGIPDAHTMYATLERAEDYTGQEHT